MAPPKPEHSLFGPQRLSAHGVGRAGLQGRGCPASRWFLLPSLSTRGQQARGRASSDSGGSRNSLAKPGASASELGCVSVVHPPSSPGRLGRGHSTPQGGVPDREASEGPVACGLILGAGGDEAYLGSWGGAASPHLRGASFPVVLPYDVPPAPGWLPSTWDEPQLFPHGGPDPASY